MTTFLPGNMTFSSPRSMLANNQANRGRLDGAASPPSNYVSRNGQRAQSSGNWREKADPANVHTMEKRQSSSDALERMQAMQLAQQQQYLQQQQMQQNQLAQTQMALQLEAMKLQSLELQERLYASMQAQAQQAPQAADANKAKRRSNLMTGLRMTDPVPSYQQELVNDSATHETLESSGEGDMQARRGALQSLQRAQQRRSGDFSTFALPPDNEPSRPNRLSFNGGDGLLERAMARKSAALSTPPPTQTSFFSNVDATRGHHRSTSSMSSTASDILSDSRKKLISPSGPTLVLSSPGEAFPSPTLGKTQRARRLTVSTKKTSIESDNSSSGPDTPGSETSEVLSFESNTSVSTGHSIKGMMVDAKGVRHVDSLASLNPTAPAFTPGQVKSDPASVFGDAHYHGNPYHIGQFSASPPQLHSVPVTSNAGVFRTFSPPPNNQAVVTVLRQPKGPAREEDLPSKNFAARSRRRNFSNITKALTKRSTSGGSTCSSPTQPFF